MADRDPETSRHQPPLGTLIIVGIYGLLFLIGWVAVYLFVYSARGPVTP